MQNQSKYAISLSFFPLPEDFPVHVMAYEQDDRRITRLHRHNYLELGYCRSGSGIFIIDGKILGFKAGDAVVIGPDEVHLASSTRGTVSRWDFCMIDPVKLLKGHEEADRRYFTSDGLGGIGFRNIISEDDDAAVPRGIRELADEVRAAGPGYRTLVRGLAADLMVRLHRLAPVNPVDPMISAETIPALAPALTHLAAHYREPCRIPELAAGCSLSESQFRRHFIAATGMTPQAYLLQLRIQNACMQLVTTEKRIIDISLESGFDTLSSFNRQFRKIMGTAPRDYRKKAGTG